VSVEWWIRKTLTFWRDKSRKRQLTVEFEGKWDIGEDLFKSFVNDAFARKADFLILTSDNILLIDWKAPKMDFFDISRRLKNMLNEKFKTENIPVFYSLGNHEKYINDAFHDEENYMLENMAKTYKDYLNEDAYNTFRHIGIL